MQHLALLGIMADQTAPSDLISRTVESACGEKTWMNACDVMNASRHEDLV